MEKLPKQIMDRFTSVFTQEQITHLESIFTLERRPVTLRANTIKSSLDNVSHALDTAGLDYTILSFPKNCFLLGEDYTESDIWDLDIYKNGDIYMQNISSQVPVHFFWKTDSTKIKILDACAAPGGKTSQLSALYPDAEIYAFEPHKVRYEKMIYNLKKLWCENITAIHDEIRNIWKYITEFEYFDFILIDAPCSWEGAISVHNTKFVESWDISHIKKNYKRQKYILSDALPYLKNWWELIYSTCTIAPEENEAVVHFALCNYPELKLQKLDFQKNKYINFAPSLKSFEKLIFKSEISEKAIRVIPSEYSEWFFIAKFKKWII